MSPKPQTIRNPLDGLASVIAVRDLRHQLQQTLANASEGTAWERDLLALDPLTVLRCLRIAHSPVYENAGATMTIDGLCELLGPAMVRRALNTRASDIAGTEPIRRLWLHALATAHAARTLAKASGACDPEEAYLLGLIHDLPLWLHYLSLRRTGRSSDIAVKTWADHWHLPARVADVVEYSMLGIELGSENDGTATVVSAGEMLAELADFAHPDHDALADKLLRSVVTAEDLTAARRLREEVTQTLARFGLSTDPVEPVASQPFHAETGHLFRVRDQGNVMDLVLGLLGCKGSPYYRGILTATTASCLRYLGFERAYCVQFSPDTGRCYLRAKADLSPRRMSPTTLQPSPRELQLLRHAVDSGTPQHLVNEGAYEPGLLRHLGSDEVLAVALNREFERPTIVVMDRALSGSPIRLSRDRIGALAMAGTASMLAENLLLQRQRERAQKFSLTDSLTRLYNRSVGIAALEQELARARRSDAPLTILMLDLDDFKKLNDTRGHLVGDQALRVTADVLRKTMRKTDTVCRYGGEEFLVVLPDTSLDEGSISATRIFTAVEEAGKQHDLPLTISIGLATVRPSEDDVESALARADRALYASKSRGRNRFSIDVE